MSATSFCTFTIVGLLFAAQLTLGQSWPKLAFKGGLVEDGDHGAMQKVLLECFVLPSNQKESHLSSMASEESDLQSVERVYYNYSRFELLLNGSRLKSSPPILVNYSSTMVGDSKLSASFYLPKDGSFYGQFECNFSSLQLNSSASLVLFYASYRKGHDLLLTVLAATFFGLFLISFFLVVISACLAGRYCFRRKNEVQVNLALPSSAHAESAASVTANHFRSACSDSCCSQEEANNAILKYLSHPTPCTEDCCPCYQYKDEGSGGCRLLEPEKCAGKTRGLSWTPANCDSPDAESASTDCGLDKKPAMPDSSGSLSSNYPNSLLKSNDCELTFPEYLPCSLSSLTSAGEDPSFFVGPPDIFEVGCSGGSYSNEDHQVYLKVPEGAVPQGKMVRIKIGVGLISTKTPFLPSNSMLVSPIASFYVEGEKNFHFLRPVEITLPHFVDINDEEDVKDLKLTFLKASSHLYYFHQAKGVVEFKPKSQTATLKTKHFCSFCIAASKSLKCSKIHYRLVKVIPRLNHQMNQWRASFCVTYYLRTCLEVKKKKKQYCIQNDVAMKYHYKRSYHKVLFYFCVQVLKKQYPQNLYEMKALKRFKFPSSEYISIQFDRKLPGGWQLALETSEKVLIWFHFL